MKDFFKYVFATVVGLIAFGIIVVAFGLMSIVGMVASGEATQNVSKNSVLVLNLANVEEQSTDDLMAKLSGQSSGATGITDILSAIKKAKTNDNIKGIYIEAKGIGANYATLQEIRNALQDFKESKKFIVAYGDSYSQADYYLASVATKIYLNPQGMLDWHGMGSQPMFLKDVFEKFGIKYQVVKVGTFKSATEAYTETKMSDANREQVSQFIQGTWNQVVKDVAASRNISADSLNKYADELALFESTAELKNKKLIDEVVYADQMKQIVKKLLDIDEDDSINQISVAGMKNVKGGKKKGDEIAIYYAYGSIVQEEGFDVLNSGHNIVGPTVCDDLQKLMDDDDVKAVVLRVNSPGGDAYASEQIWHMVTQLKAKKPVVVSMGDYAASGGYYISCAANWIVAQPTTLTGSIGIFGAFPDYSGLVTQKLGVKFDEVKTNKNSTFGNAMARPFNAEELSYLQKYIDRGYELFRKRVADGRRQPVEAIEKIAQGRVWLGQDALGIKLVDQLGGLDDAVKKAAKLAKTDNYYTSNYPAPPSFEDQIFSSLSGNGNYLDEQLRVALGDLYQPFAYMRTMNKRAAIQARIPYIINMN